MGESTQCWSFRKRQAHEGRFPMAKSKKLQSCLLGAIVLTAGCTPIAQAANSAQVSDTPALPTGAVQTVFDYYFKIQTALAQDSMESVAVNASVIAEIVRKDTASGFPSPLANQADALAKAKDIAAARQTFKAVSGYLIQYLKASSVPIGTFHEVHCSMANLNWLQNDVTVRNPFFGKSMLHCGTFKS